MFEEQRSHSPIETTSTPADEMVIPLLEEQLVINKRLIETGVVRLHKYAEERTESVDVPVTHVQWQVEHVPMNRVVTQKPDIRQEGDTTIYPVVEERVTILREFVVIEEVRVTRSAVTTTENHTCVLTRERLVEERVPAAMVSSPRSTQT